jgi:membrane-bound lytic murein transglycosylase D
LGLPKTMDITALSLLQHMLNSQNFCFQKNESRVMAYSWYKKILAMACALVSTVCFAATNPSDGLLQNNAHLTSEHKQKLAKAIVRYRNADNLWDVLREEFVLPHYEDNPYVREQIVYLMNHQEFLMHSAEHAAPYLYFILQQVRKRHLPAELVLLPMIESAYNPFAYSYAGAAGVWQMMPDTATGYGVKQNWWYDGRRDVISSTKAALDYLSYLGSFFEGNWLLALAAYNTGEGNMISAIRKNYRIGRSTEFWSLPVSQQTRDYVPRLLALAEIISHPDRYSIEFPYVKNAPYLAQIDVGAQIDLRRAANYAGLELKDMLHLNPGFNRKTTAPYGPHKLILPIENVRQFSENFSRNPNFRNMNLGSNEKYRPIKNIFKRNRAQQKNPMQKLNPPYVMQPGDTIYMVRNSDTLQKIAKHYQLLPETLVAVNRLKSNYVSAGDKLIIPTHIATVQPTFSNKYDIIPGDTVYMVRKHDTIEKIAKKFNVSPSHIRIVNYLASNDVSEGDRLVIPTHG